MLWLMIRHGRSSVRATLRSEFHHIIDGHVVQVRKAHHPLFDGFDIGPLEGTLVYTPPQDKLALLRGKIHVCAVVYRRLFPTPLRIDVRSVRERKHRGRAKRHLQLLSLRCRRGRCHQSIWEHFAGKENLQMRGGLAAAHRARSQACFLLAPAAISHVATSIASARLAGFGHLFLQIRYYEKKTNAAKRGLGLCWAAGTGQWRNRQAAASKARTTCLQGQQVYAQPIEQKLA